MARGRLAGPVIARPESVNFLEGFFSLLKRGAAGVFAYIFFWRQCRAIKLPAAKTKKGGLLMRVIDPGSTVGRALMRTILILFAGAAIATLCAIQGVRAAELLVTNFNQGTTGAGTVGE
jgi:hypothetical protein